MGLWVWCSVEENCWEKEQVLGFLISGQVIVNPDLLKNELLNYLPD